MQLNKKITAQIQSIIQNAKNQAIRSVNFERVLMYWQIGQVIFEEEQQGKERADYGTFLIKSLAYELQPQFGSGFSVRQLELCRQFYKTFQNTNALHSQLNWTQYKLLIRIENESKREFYIVEATKNNWSARQLERQINSLLFERLIKSNDVKSVLEVANLEKQDFENRTIGILLCTDKNDAVVKISLPENNQTIMTSKYQLYLPKEEDLRNEIKRIYRQQNRKN